MSSIGLVESDQGVRVHVAMTFRKRSGRKQIIVPEGLGNAHDSTPNYHESLVVAISRAHRWKRMLDEGKYRSMADLARALNMNRYCLARVLRLTLLAPDIIEDILDGREPDGISLEMLRGPMPMGWGEQRWQLLDCAGSRSDTTCGSDAWE